MSRTVTALYDTRAEAETARQRLGSAMDVDRVRIIDQQSASSGGGSLSNLHMSDEDRHAYGEGIKRGGFLLCAEVESGQDPDRIISILEESSSVDLDERQQSWRSEGWSPHGATGSTGGATTQSQGTTGTSGSVVEEQHIPIVQEELRVGKREVARGGARVRSYVRETPVQEEVTLREEHVHIERRPVEQQVSQSELDSGGLLQERTVEMREMAEEAVVQKVAAVHEEVVVTKTAEERSQRIEDTVRRTEVEVDEGASTDRSAFGGFGSGSSQDRTPR